MGEEIKQDGIRKQTFYITKSEKCLKVIKHSNVHTLIINMESISLEESERTESGCFWEKLEGVGRCGAFYYILF